MPEVRVSRVTSSIALAADRQVPSVAALKPSSRPWAGAPGEGAEAGLWRGMGARAGAGGIHSGGTSATFQRRWRRFAPAPTSDPPGLHSNEKNLPAVRLASREAVIRSYYQPPCLMPGLIPWPSLRFLAGTKELFILYAPHVGGRRGGCLRRP